MTLSRIVNITGPAQAGPLELTLSFNYFLFYNYHLHTEASTDWHFAVADGIPRLPVLQLPARVLYTNSPANAEIIIHPIPPNSWSPLQLTSK